MKLLTENYLRHFICSKFSVYNLLQRTVEQNRHKVHQKLQKYKSFTTRKRKSRNFLLIIKKITPKFWNSTTRTFCKRIFHCPNS